MPKKPKPIHPILREMRQRIGDSFQLIRQDMDALPELTGVEHSPMATIGVVVLDDGDVLDSCCLVNGRQDIVMHNLAVIMVEAGIHPIEIIPIFMRVYADKQEKMKAERAEN